MIHPKAIIRPLEPTLLLLIISHDGKDRKTLYYPIQTYSLMMFLSFLLSHCKCLNSTKENKESRATSISKQFTEVDIIFPHILNKLLILYNWLLRLEANKILLQNTAISLLIILRF